MGWQYSDQRKDIPSAMVAESWAIRLALSHAATLGFTEIHILSDCQSLIKITMDEEDSTELYGLFYDICMLSLLFPTIYFHFIYRKVNIMADSIAKSILPVLELFLLTI